MFKRTLQSIVLAASVLAGGCGKTHEFADRGDAGLVDVIEHDANGAPDGFAISRRFDNGYPDAGVPDAGPPIPLIFMVEGQSNASGRGLFSELPAWEPDPGITMLTNAWTWRVASEPLDDPTGSVNPTMDDTAGVGPGLAFARRLRESLPDTPIVLVPCNKGGTSIREWQRTFLPNHFYAICLHRALYAQAYTHGHLAGMIWYQGESDTRRVENADAFYDLTATMIRDFRMDIGIEDLPVLLVRLHPTNPDATIFPYWSQVRDAQQTFDAEPDVTVVEADGALKSDRIHLATSAQLALGERLADRYVGEFLHR